MVSKINEFLNTGFVSLTSPSIVRDCAQLLFDLYDTGVQLKYLPKNEESEIALQKAYALINKEKSVNDSLLAISNTVKLEIAAAAKKNRNKVSQLYDIAKHLQAFHNLLGNPDIQTCLISVLKTKTMLMHKDSIGMRIDLPNETAQLTDLHQEFHSFPFGLNAAVLWIPLTRISRFFGTLVYYPRSHLSEPIPYEGNSEEQNRLLAQGRLQEAQKAGGLQVTPEELGPAQYLDTEPGHCYIFSTLLPHGSVAADPSANSARLTCQARFFDSHDPFMIFKSEIGNVWDGLKRPSMGWQFWKDYSNR